MIRIQTKNILKFVTVSILATMAIIYILNNSLIPYLQLLPLFFSFIVFIFYLLFVYYFFYIYDIVIENQRFILRKIFSIFDEQILFSDCLGYYEETFQNDKLSETHFKTYGSKNRFYSNSFPIKNHKLVILLKNKTTIKIRHEAPNYYVLKNALQSNQISWFTNRCSKGILLKSSLISLFVFSIIFVLTIFFAKGDYIADKQSDLKSITGTLKSCELLLEGKAKRYYGIELKLKEFDFEFVIDEVRLNEKDAKKFMEKPKEGEQIEIKIHKDIFLMKIKRSIEPDFRTKRIKWHTINVYGLCYKDSCYFDL